MADDAWLVVGLGNPGPTYASTRHNAGFMVVDELVSRAGGKLKSHKSRCDVLEARLSGVRAVLAEPRSYMNESGGPVAALRDYYKVGPERLVVVHDELDIPFGTVRLKLGGGDNGHNGLRSIRRSIGSGEFLRVRFGIGRPPGRTDPAAFVLKDFSGTERKDLAWAVDRTATPWSRSWPTASRPRRTPTTGRRRELPGQPHPGRLDLAGAVGPQSLRRRRARPRPRDPCR